MDGCWEERERSQAIRSLRVKERVGESERASERERARAIREENR